MGDTDGYTAITDVRQINFNDKAAVVNEIEQFTKTYAYANIEHALVITPQGKVYCLQGNEIAVNPGVINRDKLMGSIVIHNHPKPNADSFSSYDFISFFDFGFVREDVV